MATKIRLKRTGAKGNPNFRVVVMDEKKPRDGFTVEELGHYCPQTNPPTFKIDANRALHWLYTGAQPSDTVKSLLKKLGIMDAFRKGVKPGELTLDAPVRAEDIVLEDAEADVVEEDAETAEQ